MSAGATEIHGLGTRVQVTPPSLVWKLFVSLTFQIVAWSASVSRIPPRSSPIGEVITFQCAPPSVVRSTAPARPTIQQTLSEGAEPVHKSTITPVVCRDQDLPLSLENSILPARPARQMTLEPGAAINRGLEIVTTSIIGVAS